MVSAAGGAKVGTGRMWNFAESIDVPTLGFIAGADRERADFDDALESMRTMGANAIAITLPIGSGPDLTGVIDLLNMINNLIK